MDLKDFKGHNGANPCSGCCAEYPHGFASCFRICSLYAAHNSILPHSFSGKPVLHQRQLRPSVRMTRPAALHAPAPCSRMDLPTALP